MKKTIRMAAMALSALLCFTAGAVTDPTYKVTVKEGTEDAANWTIDPAAATNTGVKAGTTITAAYGGAKTFKATEAKGGKATISDTEASTVELANKGDIMTLVIGKEGVAGSGKIAGAEYEINGSLNRVKTDKASYDAWKGARTAMLADETGATVATFSFNVKMRGQVLVKGRFANGKKTSCTAQLMVADDGSEACILVKGSKRMPFAAVVWFGANGETTVESVMTNIAGSVKLRYANDKRKAAALKVNFAGVFIDGIGYGMMKSGEFVTIVPDVK